MCLSRLHRVVSVDPENAVVEEACGQQKRISLLAFDGPPPRPGEWLIVHAGFAIGRMDDDEARRVLADLETVQGGVASDGAARGQAEGTRQ